MTQNQQYRQSPKVSKNGLVHFPNDGPLTRRRHTFYDRASNTSGRRRERFGRRAKQCRTKTPKLHETRRNAAERTQRCAHYEDWTSEPMLTLKALAP